MQSLLMFLEIQQIKNICKENDENGFKHEEENGSVQTTYAAREEIHVKTHLNKVKQSCPGFTYKQIHFVLA